MPELRFDLEPSSCKVYIVTQYTPLPPLKYLPMGLWEMAESSNLNTLKYKVIFQYHVPTHWDFLTNMVTSCAVLCLVAQSCPTLCDPMDWNPAGSFVHGNSPGKNTGVGRHALLQRIFPMQGSNPALPCCRRILYHLNHQGTPRILEWVAYPFSRGSSWARNRTGVSWIAGGFLPAELPGKPHLWSCISLFLASSAQGLGLLSTSRGNHVT